MDEIKVSVCIPVYNGATFLKEAIDSVLQQSFTDFELLIIDNHSTDNTIEIIKSYIDKRIQLIQNVTNIGLIPNWNKAIENAKGKYIKILPADDLIYPDCLKTQVTILDNDVSNNISLVCGRKNVINDKGKIIFNRGYSKIDKKINGIEAINKVMRSGGNIIGEGGMLLFRKEIIKKTGVFNSDIFYLLDLDLWLKMLLHGNLYAQGSIVGAFRISHSSESVKITDLQKKDCILFLNKIYEQKVFQLKGINYFVGKISIHILAIVKKVVYKFLLNGK